jgi:hypothetical protein
MANDLVMLRIDLEGLRTALGERPEYPSDPAERELFLDRMLASFQCRIEEEAAEFAAGRGAFETCLFDAV